MAESFSVKAILSAQDKGFSSAMKAASQSVSNLKSTIAGGLGFGVLAGIGQSAFNAITSGVSGLVSELNSSSAAWKTFQGNMEMNGHTADEIASIKSELQDFATQTIYSASDMASTFAQLDAVGTKNTKDLVKGFGGLAAAAENPAQAMKTLSQQATQAAAKPYIQWADFRLMLEQTPAGMSAVAKEMGMSMDEMVLAVQDGTVATEDFFDAIAKVGTNEAFTKMATEYKTVGQAMDGLTETVSNKLAPAFDVLSSRGISAISGIVDAIGELDGEAVAGKLTSFLDKASGYWNVLKTNALEVGSAFGDAFSAIGKSLSDLTGAFGSTESIENFSDVIGVAKDALVGFAGFLENNSDAIAKVITQLPKLFVAYKGFKILRSITPLVSAFSGAILSLGSSIINKIAPNLTGISKGQDAVGKSSLKVTSNVLQSAQAFALMGAGILLVSGGFALLAKSSIALAESGGAAIAVMVGMVAAVVALGAGFTVMTKAITATPAQLQALGVALVALGASVLLVSAGFAVMAQSSIALSEAGTPAIATMFGMVAAMGALMAIAALLGKQLTSASVGLVAFGAAILIAGAGMYVMSSAAISLTNAGTPAIAVMAGMVVAMAALMALAAALGPALTAGSIGFIAFGAAIVLVASGALIASAALAVVAAVLPTVSEYGSQGAVAIAELGAAMLVFAAGSAAAGVASVALAAGLVAVGASAIVAAAGTTLLAAGATALGAGLLIVTASGTALAAVLPMLASGALSSAAGFTALLASATGLSAIMLALTAAMAAFAVSSAASTVALLAFSAAMAAGTVGTAAMAAALVLVNSSMKSIATNAKSAQSSITSMRSSLDVVNEGLDALGNKAKSAVNKLISTFSNSAGKAKSAGKKVGDGVNDGAKSGLDKLPSTANNAMNRFNSGISSGGARAVSTARSMASSIVSALNTAQSGAYSAGYNIGAGLANGMSASLGRVQSIATQLAAAAERAIRAEAQIHSPSRVTDKLGQYFGEGWVEGIKSMARDAKQATAELIAIPSLPDVPTPSLAGYGGGNWELSEDYSYTRNTKYTIVIPVNLEGKEVSRITAPFMEEDLRKREKVNNMINGIR